jgi:S1-C subfamily serine protease
MDKFTFSSTLSKRFTTEELAAIEKGFKTDINKLDFARLRTKMVMAQVEQEPIFYAIQKALPAACLIIVNQSGTEGPGSTWTGSGFLIQPGVVVTSAHVLPSTNYQHLIKVSFDGISQFDAEILSIDEKVDIGTLRVDHSLKITPPPIAKQPSIIGEEIAVLGAPEGWENVITVGHVSAVDKTPQILPDPSWEQLIFIDSDIYEGSSGSMVINTRGEIIGMVMGIIGKHAAELQMGQNSVIPIAKVLQAIQNVV